MKNMGTNGNGWVEAATETGQSGVHAAIATLLRIALIFVMITIGMTLHAFWINFIYELERNHPTIHHF